MRSKIQLLLTGIISGVVAVAIYQKIAVAPTAVTPTYTTTASPQFTTTNYTASAKAVTLNNEDLDYLNSIFCVQSEEVSEIKLQRFKDKRDEHNRNYNELNLDGNVSVGSNSESWK